MFEIKDKLITPADGLRLPDAITVKFGPAELLTRFILGADKEARDKGLKLRLRHNFPDLLALNQAETARGNWFNLMMVFDPRITELSPENAFWISAENEDGEIVACQAARVYHWPETTLADEARLMFFGGRDIGQECEITTPAAREVAGWVYYGGALWVHPDYRGREFGLSALFPRLIRAYAATRWPIDWTISFVLRPQVEKGIVRGYGYKDVTWSVKFSKSVIGDIETALIRMTAPDVFDDLRSYLETRSAPARKPEAAPESAVAVA